MPFIVTSKKYHPLYILYLEQRTLNSILYIHISTVTTKLMCYIVFCILYTNLFYLYDISYIASKFHPATFSSLFQPNTHKLYLNSKLSSNHTLKLATNFIKTSYRHDNRKLTGAHIAPSPCPLPFMPPPRSPTSRPSPEAAIVINAHTAAPQRHLPW